MATREERLWKIREGLTLLMSECYSKEGSACKLHPVFQPQKFLNKLFPYLHSQGVVIKVDRELPKLYDAEHPDGFNLPSWCNEAYKRAGYVAVESLIEPLIIE